MTKPKALSDYELEYVGECLKHQWPWYPNKWHLIAGLYAMAVERNALLKEKGEAKAVNTSVYGC
jgi:hypothetical protein